ncbi:MAG: PEP/pyruvate-binding domain-containing protein [Lysobacterales bacterium]
MVKLSAFILAALTQIVPVTLFADEAQADISKFRTWVSEMEDRERGPFSRLRWFCNDGTVLPPGGYTCKDHGGGFQHGEWSDKTLELRQQGYLVANVLAGLDATAWVDDPDFSNRYAQLLVERFLVSTDDGWIMRRALFYRGAIQEEDERAAARALLTEMSSREHWIGAAFPALRAGVRMLPHGADNASIQKVRQMSASLSDRDERFKPLRAKIHGSPGAEDAESVRAYAAELRTAANRLAYLELADEIDGIYRAAPLDVELDNMAADYPAALWFQYILQTSAEALRDDTRPAGRFKTTALLLADLRRALPRIYAASDRLDILDLSLRVEVENFSAANALRSEMGLATRGQRLDYLKSAGTAAFGTGVINERLLAEMDKTFAALAIDETGLDTYMRDLNYLGRAPGWGTQALRMYFYQAMEKLAQIEPLALLFIQDQLRASPLLLYSKVLDGLSRDANRLAGVKHRLFNEEIGVGFTALNAGLARGILHVKPDIDTLENFKADGIYLLPETVSDLPPVAGILTAGEGNPLSHIQLLARNLGIPNVTVDTGVVASLARHDGEMVVMAVSKSGLVEISPWSDGWNKVFENADVNGVIIRPDLEKLDLTLQELVPLDDLRADDSGRTVGPKAAKLGELRSHYPGNVSRGMAIPFGIFRQEAFEQTYPGGDGTVFEWMVKSYAELASIPVDDPARAGKAEAFRAELYDIVSNTQLSPGFMEKLDAAMKLVFGPDDPPGVFVRSDTNVEDLAGFTGAGLNLTLPNVVGYENLLKAIPEVWASPFTVRAFAWRQSHMTQPEHVYTSILLLESVASDKSGVLVTEDIDTGNRGVVSVAVNEGLGGAVDGQAAESLRIPLDGSPVRVLATATAPWRRVPNPGGGLTLLPSSGSDTVLQAAEIEQLIDFAQHLPEKFPAITDDDGNPAPADVEFGFVNGDLRLFQLRPFLDSKMAKGIGYLQQMDARLKNTASISVDMNGVPKP